MTFKLSDAFLAKQAYETNLTSKVTTLQAPDGSLWKVF
jgi:hypothetical protein